MNRLILILLLALSLPLHSLEVRLNGRLFEFYSAESLRDLSYHLPGEEKKGIYLRELLPLMKDYRQFTLYTGDYILKTDPSDDLIILAEEDYIRLKGDNIGTVPLPHVIEIEGMAQNPTDLLIWMDREDHSIRREIDLFSRLHQIPVQYRIEEGLVSLLEYNSFNDRRVPDLIFFSGDKLNRLSPLLNSNDIHTFKFSRSILLNGSSDGENSILAADFGDLDLFYSLMLRFGLEDDFSPDSLALGDALFYLRQLYADGLYRISEDPFSDFLSGKQDIFYGDSKVLSRLDVEPLLREDRALPRLDGMNPRPVKSHIMVTVPEKSREQETASALLSYMRGYGVQQRINPESGFLPEETSVYPLLPESPSKVLMMEDLESAFTLESSETMDKLTFVLSKIYRLVVTRRLTVEEGMKEISDYLMPDPEYPNN